MAKVSSYLMAVFVCLAAAMTYDVISAASVADRTDTSLDDRTAFSSFNHKHHKTHKNSTDNERRFQNFMKTHKIITDLNKKNSSVKLAHNQFSDMDASELKKYLGGKDVIRNTTRSHRHRRDADTQTTEDLNPTFQTTEDSSPILQTTEGSNPTSQTAEYPNTTPQTTPQTTVVPTPTPQVALDPSQYMNYTALGYVTPVEDQGDCSSCWAYACVGAIEAAYFGLTGNLITFSVQQVIDCATSWFDGSINGCNGGFDTDAYHYVQRIGGLAQKLGYDVMLSNPTLNSTDRCRAVRSIATQMSLSYQQNTQSDEALLQAIENNGPLAVNLFLGGSFFYYSSGIIDGSDPNYCSGWHGHDVLLVGYGTDETTGTKYWYLKNSWGSWWGENGFFRLTRNQNDHCKINQQVKLINLSLPDY